jgi:hypothetical protein
MVHGVPHAVAIARLPRELEPGGYRTAPTERVVDPERWLPSLASRVGLTVYDLRMRLTGEAPWVIAHAREAADAEALVASLRAAGFGAVRCDLDARPWSAVTEHWLSLRDDAVAFEPHGPTVAYASVRVMVLAVLDAEHGDESVEKVVVARRQRGAPVTADVSRFSYARKQQRVLYLYAGDGRWSVRLTQESMRTTAVTGLTSRERFDRVVAALRARCPGALVDERFVGGPRRRTSFAQSAQEGARRGSVSDNAVDTDLAAWALCLAAESGQL